MVQKIIRLEGLFVFIAAVYFYYTLNGNWILFIILLLTPDISMVGYLKNKKLGSITYNLIHNYILAALITAAGFFTNNPVLQFTGLILFAHVALDRLLGFGLKYPIHFKDTHIQKL